jgi:hypothetical protein
MFLRKIGNHFAAGYAVSCDLESGLRVISAFLIWHSILDSGVLLHIYS